MNKVLSIIVPAYNVEAYLSDGLRSLVVADRTALDALEVIVVNDGSGDRTSEIAHGFAHEFPSVFKVIDKTNGNYGSCINVGLKNANGMYVRILDGDDSYDTGAFERYMRFVIKETRLASPCDVIFNDFTKVDPSGKVLEYKSQGFIGREGATLADFDCQNGRMVWAPAISYRLELLHRIGYEQTEGISYTDQEWDMIPMMHVKSFAYCPEAIYRYLIGRPEQSCNDAVRLRNFAMHFPVAKKIISAYLEGQRNKNVGLTNLQCMDAQIKMHIHFFYSTYLIGGGQSLDVNDLIKYDEFLKQTNMALYQYAGSLSVLRWPISFFYAREWRRKYTRRTIKFMLLKVYVTFRALISKVRI